jgi:hypothetical protein
VVCADGTVLVNPTVEVLARCIGMVDALEHAELFDVAVVGAGPPFGTQLDRGRFTTETATASRGLIW